MDHEIGPAFESQRNESAQVEGRHPKISRIDGIAIYRSVVYAGFKDPGLKERSLHQGVYEIDVLTRNADGVLQFDEHFGEELRTAMAPLGIHMELSPEHTYDKEISVGNVESIDAGIAYVSTKFATEVDLVF
ncbi:hypothetical protein GG344DRAFT_67687 [Lentinula edodes]|nr:hypothetical protein GG344DRAFT_67687 [Lentinula edodes]